MGSQQADVVLTVLLATLLVLALVTFMLLRRQRIAASRRATVPAPDVPAGDRGPLPRLAIIANPTKLADVDERKAWAAAACAAAGWGEPIWLETTVEDPGTGQAREAVALGAATVAAYGGDGTVRSVAAGLADSGVPLALIPAGTGNLLARNLAVPLGDPDAALAVALSATTRTIDVAQAGIDVSGEDQDVVPRLFLVMAGLGFDAEVMAAVEPRLKERVGWMAYVVTGARRLRGQVTRLTLQLDEAPVLRRRVRSVIVGNCGELTGGVRLLPDAEVDDGWLDVVVVSAKGLMGWAAVTLTVLTRNRRGHPVVELFRCRSVELRPESALPVQLDGDPAGEARAMRVRVDPAALEVKVPISPIGPVQLVETRPSRTVRKVWLRLRPAPSKDDSTH